MERTFGTMRGALKGGRRKLHMVELYNLNASPDITVAMKSRKMRRVWPVARSGGMRSAWTLSGNLKGRGRLEDLSFADDRYRDDSLNFGLFAIQPLSQLLAREYFIHYY
jgi:hypothetical protein